ncbi:MAG: sigma-70 family RNA polymerase sigma factor [Actinomycetales bacterium]
MTGGQRRLRAVVGSSAQHAHSEGSAHAAVPVAAAGTPEALIAHVARGDERSFEQLYDEVGGQVHGLVRRVLRDPAQSEEVTQEVFLEIWRTASRFDPSRGRAMTWVMTIAHARAVDRVRSAQAATDREVRVGQRDYDVAYDEVSEAVESRLERVQVRRCLDGLTALQRESLTLAYYAGYTYNQVADLLSVPLGTVKTRLRDGLIRMRDCMGVEA